MLPRDVAATVAAEQTLVQSGIHSRKRAMAGLGVENPEREFADWLAEREAILKMNRTGNPSNRVRERDRVTGDGEIIKEE